MTEFERPENGGINNEFERRVLATEAFGARQTAEGLRAKADEFETYANLLDAEIAAFDTDQPK